ncbi:MAG TPA: TorF family putative porin [Opitutales bacterium]|jgi:uncharacterized protein (TIGR02001 family)|nr:TorF family putative porin [Opitutales bacterium]
MYQSLINKSLLALAVAAALAPAAHAQSQSWGTTTGVGSVSYESQYVFRGKKITNSAVQPKGEIILTPNGSSNFDVYVGAWMNQPVSRRGAPPAPDQSDEVDVWAGLEYALPSDSNTYKFTLDLGDTYYWYPDAGGSSLPTPTGSHASFSDEVNIGLTWNMPPIANNTTLVPKVFYYHDFILASDTVEVSLSTKIDLKDMLGFNGFTITPTIRGGWTTATKAFGDQLPAGTANWHNGYKYWQAGLELDYALSEDCYLFGNVDYAGNDDGKTGAPVIIGGNPQWGGTPNSVWFGAGLRFQK